MSVCGFARDRLDRFQRYIYIYRLRDLWQLTRKRRKGRALKLTNARRWPSQSLSSGAKKELNGRAKRGATHARRQERFRRKLAGHCSSLCLSLARFGWLAGWLVSLARTQTCFAEEKTGLWLLHLQTTAAARVFIHEN